MSQTNTDPTGPDQAAAQPAEAGVPGPPSDPGTWTAFGGGDGNDEVELQLDMRPAHDHEPVPVGDLPYLLLRIDDDGDGQEMRLLVQTGGGIPQNPAAAAAALAMMSQLLTDATAQAGV